MYNKHVTAINICNCYRVDSCNDQTPKRTRTIMPTQYEPCDLPEKFPVKSRVADSWWNTILLLLCGPHHLQLAGSSDTEPCLLPTAGTEWIWESWNYLPRSLCLTARRRALWCLGHFCTRMHIHRGGWELGCYNVWSPAMVLAPCWRDFCWRERTTAE